MMRGTNAGGGSAIEAQGLTFRYRFGSQSGYEYISPAVREITGYTPGEYYANPELDVRIVHPEDQQVVHDLIGLRRQFGVFRIIRKDGTLRWVAMTTLRVHGDEGELIALEGIARALNGGSVPYAESLSGRERDVLELIANGLTDSQIAKRLGISRRTVAHHVGHILVKFGARNRTGAVIAAYQAGLLDPRLANGRSM